MAELRGGRDEPNVDDLPARRFPAEVGDAAGEARPRHEPSTRTEYAEVARQNTERTDKNHKNQEDADQVAEPFEPDPLERFEPRRAGLPDISRADAVAYIEEHQSDRPWLAKARDCSPEVQRVFAALDQGRGHAHIRHEGWVTEEMNERRVRNLEDPAQLDPDKREARVDAFKAGDQPHWCGSIATRITDPETFATAFARGVEHPDVRAALDSTGPFSSAGQSADIRCARRRRSQVLRWLATGTGRREHAGGRANRDAWAAGDHSVPEPRSPAGGDVRGRYA